MKTIVLKFGGAAVSSPERFSRIASIITERRKEYDRLVIVVSAMGETTNQLIQLAKQIHPNPPQREYDMLISVGERISMSLLAMALMRKKQDAMSFTGSQSGIITCCNHTEARIIDVNPWRVSACLQEGKVAIVAGFQGVSKKNEITTLGRGGSDTSAVALAVALKASKIEFFKDVPGVFNYDPKVDLNAVQYDHLTFDQALEIVSKGAKILHNRAILLAKKNGLPLHVKSFITSQFDNKGTIIDDADIVQIEKPVYEME